MAITNYGREVAGTLTRRADSSPGWMQGGVVVGVLDLMGGKPGCAFGDGAVSPTVTRGARERERRPRGRDRGGLTNG